MECGPAELRTGLADPCCLNELTRYGELISSVREEFLNQGVSSASLANQIQIDPQVSFLRSLLGTYRNHSGVQVLNQWIDGAVDVGVISGINNAVVAGLLTLGTKETSVDLITKSSYTTKPEE